MKLYIKQKIFSWNDKFSVYDANGEERYFVEGEFFSWGKKLHVYDQYNREVAFIKQALFTWMPCYHVYVSGTEVAQIRREFTFFRPRYRVDGLNWEVDGSFWEWDYEIVDASGHLVASVSKEIWHLTDTYTIDVADDADALYALMVVLAIDAEKCSRND